jgi:pyruvate formate lyase activating enzyme
VDSIERAVYIGHEAGLRYVYGGNVPGHSSETTSCPDCGAKVMERAGNRLMRGRMHGGRCPECGRPIAGRFEEGQS